MNREYNDNKEYKNALDELHFSEEAKNRMVERLMERVRCFTWNIDRPEKVSRETVPPCFAPMFHVEQFRHLFHAFVSHETKVPSLRMAPQSVDKVCFHAKTAVARQRAFKSVCCANA